MFSLKSLDKLTFHLTKSELNIFFFHFIKIKKKSCLYYDCRRSFRLHDINLNFLFVLGKSACFEAKNNRRISVSYEFWYSVERIFYIQMFRNRNDIKNKVAERHLNGTMNW